MTHSLPLLGHTVVRPKLMHKVAFLVFSPTALIVNFVDRCLHHHILDYHVIKYISPPHTFETTVFLKSS